MRFSFLIVDLNSFSHWSLASLSQSSAWSETEGVAQAPWTGPVDLKRKIKRTEEIETGLMRCHALSTPKLREQVRASGPEIIWVLTHHQEY